MENNPSRGTIARNEKGELGIIVDVFGGIAVGFAIPVDRRRWSSHHPEVLGTIQEWINSRMPIIAWAKERTST
jgi:hypothetical protein